MFTGRTIFNNNNQFLIVCVVAINLDKSNGIRVVICFLLVCYFSLDVFFCRGPQSAWIWPGWIRFVRVDGIV